MTKYWPNKRSQQVKGSKCFGQVRHGETDKSLLQRACFMLNATSLSAGSSTPATSWWLVQVRESGSWKQKLAIFLLAFPGMFSGGMELRMSEGYILPYLRLYWRHTCASITPYLNKPAVPSFGGIGWGARPSEGTWANRPEHSAGGGGGGFLQKGGQALEKLVGFPCQLQMNRVMECHNNSKT